MASELASVLQDTVGSYELLKLLGEGGMGRVHHARHLESRREVAIKTVKQRNEQHALALRLEIAALRAVTHPAVVSLLEDGVHDGFPWYAMELLTGETLADYNRRLWDSGLNHTQSEPTEPTSGPMAISDVMPTWPSLRDSVPPRERLQRVLRLYRGLCLPLVHIHRRGMVHRDLKPSNVFIRRDENPVLMDFGLVAFASGALGREVLAPVQRAFGTVPYVAPERIRGHQVDARADLYAFGCMLYETLTGRPPFMGTADQVWRAHQAQEPVPPSALVDSIPPMLDELLLGLLRKEPRARIGHAADVIDVLDHALGDSVRSSEPTTVQLYRPALSGREQVLSELEHSLTAAHDGSGGLVLLSGESGIGKTFVASEFAARAGRAGVRVVTGECATLATNASTKELSNGAFHPLQGLLQRIGDACREGGDIESQRILGGRASYLAPYEPTLATLAPGEPLLDAQVLPAAAASERALSALKATVREFARGTALLLVLDDLQWADGLTLKWLAELQRDFFHGVPLLILGTFREDEAASASLQALVKSGSALSVSLSRLDASGVARMVSDMLAIGTPPPELVTFLLRESEGNPFFVAEYLRFLVLDGHLKRVSGRWQVGSRGDRSAGYESISIPESLEGLLQQRLAALGSGAASLLQAAAVLGRSFSGADLRRMTGTTAEDMIAHLHEAQERHVLEPLAGELDSYRFAHDRLRVAAYSSMSPVQAEALHLQAASALVASASAALPRSSEIAQHFRLGGDSRSALLHFEKAADAAVAKSAQRDASLLFREALEIAAELGGVSEQRLARWHYELGAALHDMGEFQLGNVELERALHLIGYRVPKSKSALPLKVTLDVVRQFLHRLFPSRRLHQQAEESPRLLSAARAFDRLQQSYYYTGDVLRMLYACLRTLNLTESASPSPELTVAYANAHAVAGILPSRKLVGIYHQRAMTNIARAPDAVSETYFLTLSGVYLTGIGAWADARATLTRALDISEKLNFARRSRELTGAIGVLEYYAGDFRVSRRQADALYAIAMDKDAHTQAWALLLRAQAALAQGEYDVALASAREASKHSEGLGQPERIWAWSLEGAASLRHGNRDEADAISRKTVREIQLAPPVNHYTIGAYAVCAEVRLALLREPKIKADPAAHRLAKQACGALNKLTRIFPVAKPPALLMEGLREQRIGDLAKAARLMEASRSTALALGMRYDAARAAFALASEDLRSHATARHLAQARADAAALGLDDRRLRPAEL